MQLVDDLSQAVLHQDTVLTIGSFDGVHRGHQHLISHVLQQARRMNLLSGLLTFYPHPAAILAPHNAPRYLTTPGEKIALLEKQGLDLVAILPFNRQLAQTSPRDFMLATKRHLRLRDLLIGSDFVLGRDRVGNLEALQALGHELCFNVTPVEPLLVEGEIISSTRIRRYLATGGVRQAAALLGRYPRLAGEVVGGARRGRRLGIPTANLAVRPERAVPADGVYAVYAIIGEQRYLGVANVGVRPSFDSGERIVETHILDFDENIYGVDLVVEFVARLRDERRFDNVDELVSQIHRDIKQTRHSLSGTPQSP
jgi:riboflavin kinase/FMN adenylyltransferase